MIKKPIFSIRNSQSLILFSVLLGIFFILPGTVTPTRAAGLAFNVNSSLDSIDANLGDGVC
ncbi:MAG: hypothetical protein ACI85U_000001, partial [Candidatus Promineifilaceae bacterium]